MPDNKKLDCKKHGEDVELARYGFDLVCKECLAEYRKALDNCPVERIQRDLEREMVK